MMRLITYSRDPVNHDDETLYRYIDEDWEALACFMNDLPMYPSEAEAREAYRREHDGESP